MQLKDYWHSVREKLALILRLDDQAEQWEVMETVHAGVEFKGAKLWILVLAVFVASLGLNVNSAAVIIGAMLISPLMGPIIGMGVGAAIYDWTLLKRSLHSLAVAALFSVMTATVYFLISPYSAVQSELLARTSPTIYDVLIALCGGLAGIIALSSTGQRMGNAIPGVAIATALMPPLCTVGFGLATANWAYALGAMYLFTINTIFIAFSTYLGSRFIMRFHPIQDADPVREKRTRRIVTILLVATIAPAIILTVGMLRKDYFEQHVSLFVQQELSWPRTQVVKVKSDYDHRTVSVLLMGEEVDSLRIEDVRRRMPHYGLDDVRLDVLQSAQGVQEEQLQSIFNANNQVLQEADARLAKQQTLVRELEKELEPTRTVRQLAPDLLREMQVLWPDVQSLKMAPGVVCTMQDTLAQTTEWTVLVLECRRNLGAQEQTRVREWLQRRSGQSSLEVIFE